MSRLRVYRGNVKMHKEPIALNYTTIDIDAFIAAIAKWFGESDASSLPAPRSRGVSPSIFRVCLDAARTRRYDAEIYRREIFIAIPTRARRSFSIISLIRHLPPHGDNTRAVASQQPVMHALDLDRVRSRDAEQPARMIYIHIYIYNARINRKSRRAWWQQLFMPLAGSASSARWLSSNLRAS